VTVTQAAAVTPRPFGITILTLPPFAVLRRGQRPAVTDTDTGKRSWQILAVVLTGSFMAVLDSIVKSCCSRS
jgi:hypothetical protein